jgi:hypothetical protein
MNIPLRLGLLLVLLLPGALVLAAPVTVNDAAPFELIPIESSALPNEYVGTLAGYPHTYELIIEQDRDIALQLTVPAHLDDVYMALLVRRDARGGGVEEISRVIVDPLTLPAGRNSELGINVRLAMLSNETLPAGQYRIEVSTPDNVGPYLLSVGGDVAIGYGSALARTRTIQNEFGYSGVRMLGSNLLYYPLGIILLVVAIAGTWYLRRRTTTDDQLQ